MGWAAHHIERLKAGETVKFRPRGNSMVGRIESGDLVTVAPAHLDEIKVNDIVLCKVRGTEYLHIVKAIRGAEYQIGKNVGRINGWTSARQIFGKVIAIDP
jgi:hypothetical protein